MAETVQFLLEQMLPEVEDLKAKGLLSEVRKRGPNHSANHCIDRSRCLYLGTL